MRARKFSDYDTGPVISGINVLHLRYGDAYTEGGVSMQCTYQDLFCQCIPVDDASLCCQCRSVVTT